MRTRVQGLGRSASSSSSSSSTAAAASSSCLFSCLSKDSFPSSRSHKSFSPCFSCVNSSSSSVDAGSARTSSSSVKVVAFSVIRKHSENRFSSTIVLVLLPHNFRWKINASFQWFTLPLFFSRVRPGIYLMFSIGQQDNRLTRHPVLTCNQGGFF